MNPYDISLERGRMRVVIATIAINVLVVSLLTFASWSDWRTGAALNVIDNCLLVGFALFRRDALHARFLVFGFVVGFTELAADAWLVDYTHTLDYSIGPESIRGQSGNRRCGCPWLGKSWRCNSDTSACGYGSVSTKLACL
jgi:hypothetical protein